MTARRSSSLLFSRWLLLLGRSASPDHSGRNNPIAGLTLIECLIAIIVISITVVAITPPVFLATASRIQARRAEQANQVAQAETDRIRMLVERGTYVTNDLPASAGTPADIKLVAAATGGVDNASLQTVGSTCTRGYPKVAGGTPVPINQLIPVDIDGDCLPEYAMQVFRAQGCVPSALASVTPPAPPHAFYMGVRVYAYTPGEVMTNLGIERANLSMTSGRRDRGAEGNLTRKPLQTLYSRMARVTRGQGALECAVTDSPAPSPSPSPTP